MGNNPRILIVEDQSIVAMDLQNRLTNLNYIVTGIASSGAGAIKKAQETNPDIILMDIMLKGDMDGIGAAQQIRARLNIPVVYLTAYADTNTLQRAKITEPFGYILKPFEERELHTTIEMALYRHMMEKQLREREEWFATTLKCIGEAIITTDKELNITFANPVAENILNLKKDELLNKNLTEVFKIIDETDKKPLNDYFDTLKQNEKPEVFNKNILVSINGKERFISKSMSSIRNEDEEIIGYVIIFKDVTDSIIINTEKHKNDKLDSLSRFSYGVSKDINNFLTAISGNISLAKLKTNINDKIYSFLDEAEMNIFKANDFLTNISRLYNPLDSIKRVVSVDILLNKGLRKVFNDRTRDYNLKISSDIYNLKIDESQVSEAIELIFKNIIIPDSKNNYIEVSAKNLDFINTENNTFYNEKNYIEILIKYHNKSHQEKLSKIFDPYVIADGVDLSVANSLINKNGGLIKLDTTEDSIIMSIILPASSENLPNRIIYDNDNLMGNEKIIIMDDESTLLDIAENMLSDMGYKVNQVKNGKELIEMYNKSLVANEPYDVIVMDLTIPGGMGGKEAIKEVLAIDPDAKVILSSGYSNDPIMSNYKEYGFRDTLVKPFRIKDLMLKIRNVLDNKYKN